MLTDTIAGRNEPQSVLRAGVAVETFSSRTLSAYVRIRILEDDLVHVETAAGKPPEDESSTLRASAMVSRRSFLGPTAFVRSEGDGVVTLSTPAVEVEVDPVTLCVRTRRIEKPGAGASPSPAALARICPDNLGDAWKGFTLTSSDTRAAYGLGQHFQNSESADGDLTGRTFESGPFGNELRGFSGGANSVVQIPLLHVLKDDGTGFGLFVDNVYKQTWDLSAGTSGPWQARMFGDVVRYFVSAKPTLRENRAAFLSLTGAPPVPPRKMFGLWVSEFGFDSWKEVETKREGLAAASFPLDGFVLDLQWFGGEFFGPNARMGTLTFSPEGFPDPAKNIARLKERGIGLITVEESYVDERLPEHVDLAARGHLVRGCETCKPAYLTANPWWGKGGMLDWSNPLAAAQWHDTKREPLIDLGILGHWTDLGEPEMYDRDGWYDGQATEGLHAHADVHNIYGLLWSQGIADGYVRNRRTARPFVLARAGAAGIQRNGVAMWSGDIGANLGALKAHANAQIHMSFSGIDYYGSDAGGFHRYSLDGNLDALYTQWFAQSALFDLPVRPHTWNTDNTHETSPAAIGHVASNRSNIALRYLLFPYYYASAHATHISGVPFVAPPVAWFPKDAELASLGHEKMLGASLLAGALADYNGTRRSFYFPEAVWFDFRSGNKVPYSGEWVKDVPTVNDQGLLELPLFARAGAIIPMLDEPVLGSQPDVHAAHGLVLRVFPAASAKESTFYLTEDDGATTEYLEGKSARTRIVAMTEGKNEQWMVTQVAVEKSVGTFSGRKETRPVLLEVARAPNAKLTSVTLSGEDLPACSEDTRTALLEKSGEGRAARLAGTPPCYVAKLAASRQFVPVWLGRAARGADSTVSLNWKDTSDAERDGASLRGIAFTCHDARTRPGEAIFVTGSHPLLGKWNLDKAVRLEPTLSPHWARLVNGFELGSTVKWKCVRLDEKGNVLEWQAGNDASTRVEPGFFAQSVGAAFTR